MDNILIAVDDARLRRLIRTAVESNRFTVIETADAASVTETIRREHPRVVFLDTFMPSGAGYAVCRAVKDDAELRDTIIVLLSNLNTIKSRDTCISAGADACLMKPFSPFQLLKVVEQTLGPNLALPFAFAVLLVTTPLPLHLACLS